MQRASLVGLFSGHERITTRATERVFRCALHLAVILTVFGFSARIAFGWIAIPETQNSSRAHSIAIDGAGNIVVVGTADDGSWTTGWPRFTVIKLSSSDGSELWRAQLPVSEGNDARAVAIDGAGDVIAAGGEDGVIKVLTVAKLAGVDGALRWMIHDGGTAQDIAVDSSGKIVVVAHTDGPATRIIGLRPADGSIYLYHDRYEDGFGFASDASVEFDSTNAFVVAARGLVKFSAINAREWFVVDDTGFDALRLFPNGDPVVAGSPSFTVKRFSGASGALLWEQKILSTVVNHDFSASTIAIDSADDVFVGGVLDGATPLGVTPVLVKLDGDDGSMLWRRDIPGLPQAMRIDASGNIILAGGFFVAKHAPDGTQVWRRSFDDCGDADSAVVDANGDVSAAGFTSYGCVPGEGVQHTYFTTVKLSGADGSDFGPSCGNGSLETAESCDDGNLIDGDGCSALCRIEPVCGNAIREITEECDDGNVLDGDGCSAYCLVQSLDPPPESVVETTAANKTVTTDPENDGAVPYDPIETAVTSPTAGEVSIDEVPLGPPSIGGRFEFLGWDVYITAPTATPEAPLRLAFRIDSSVFPLTADVSSLDVFRNGVRVFDCSGPAGTAEPDPCIISRTRVDDDVEITALTSQASIWSVATRRPGQLLVGRKLLLSDKSDPMKRKITFGSSDPALVMGTPGGTGDPTCTGAGGVPSQLEVYNSDGTGEASVHLLPCGLWSVIGKPGAEKGYKYKDAELTAGPVKSIIVADRKKLVVKAKGAGITYTLDETTQGSIAVSLSTGVSALYCTDFAGPAISRDEPGQFKASGAAAPTSCP